MANPTCSPANPAPMHINRDTALEYLYDAKEQIEMVSHYLELFSIHEEGRGTDCRLVAVNKILKNLLESNLNEVDAFISQ